MRRSDLDSCSIAATVFDLAIALACTGAHAAAASRHIFLDRLNTLSVSSDFQKPVFH
jgi:hypothetical protein